MIGFLHPRRVEVLHALALLAGGREPLPEGLERLAAEDPLLRPWADKLVPRLRAGEPLDVCLMRARLLSRHEAETMPAGDRAKALNYLIDRLTFSAWRLTVVRWLPTALTAVSVLGFNAAYWVIGGQWPSLAMELGIRWPGPWSCALSGLVAVLAVAFVQDVFRSCAFIHYFQNLWCPEIHRAAAWHDFCHAVFVSGERVPAVTGVSRWWRRTGLSAQRDDHPAWDLPWRTWWVLASLRMSREQRRQVEQQPSGAERMAHLGTTPGLTACNEARQQMEQALADGWPLVVAALWLVAFAGFCGGLMSFSGLITGVQSLG